MLGGMLSLLSRSSTYKEPLPRFHHVSCRIGNKIIVYGGLTSESKLKLSSIVNAFDNFSEKWEKRPVAGDAPSPGTYGAACTSHCNDLLFFGGSNGCELFNTLYKLDTETWLWYQVSPQNAEGAPMPKFGCGIISVGDRLGVMGGFGIPSGPTEPLSFSMNTRFNDGRGWTNEFHIYNISQGDCGSFNYSRTSDRGCPYLKASSIGGVWSCPTPLGEKPLPCAYFTITVVDDRRAVVFGGMNGERGRMNDVYILEYSTMTWKKLNKLEEEPWPEERSSHAACCLNYGQQSPQLLMTGGKNSQGQPLRDMWILDVERVKWKKVIAAKKARWGHTLTALSLGPGLTEVMEFGGSLHPLTGSDDTQTKTADTTLLQFMLVDSSGQSHWELLSVADKTQLGSPERMIEKMKLIKGECDREEERITALKEEKRVLEKEKKVVDEENKRLLAELQLFKAVPIKEREE